MSPARGFRAPKETTNDDDDDDAHASVEEIRKHCDACNALNRPTLSNFAGKFRFYELATIIGAGRSWSWEKRKSLGILRTLYRMLLDKLIRH